MPTGTLTRSPTHLTAALLTDEAMGEALVSLRQRLERAIPVKTEVSSSPGMTSRSIGLHIARVAGRAWAHVPSEVGAPIPEARTWAVAIPGATVFTTVVAAQAAPEGEDDDPLVRALSAWWKDHSPELTHRPTVDDAGRSPEQEREISIELRPIETRRTVGTVVRRSTPGPSPVIE